MARAAAADVCEHLATLEENLNSFSAGAPLVAPFKALLATGPILLPTKISWQGCLVSAAKYGETWAGGSCASSSLVHMCTHAAPHIMSRLG